MSASKSSSLAALKLTLAFLAAQSAWTPYVEAQDGQRLYMRAAAAYGDERYAEAAELFAEAYRLLGEASLLYNLGLAHERAGDVSAAIDAYDRYLREAPDASERTEVERSLVSLRRQASLERELARHAEEAAEAPAAPDSPEGVEASTEDESAPLERRGASLAPWVVVGVGAAGLVAGLALGLTARAAYADARDEPEHRRAMELERRANGLGMGANVAFIAGGVLALGGVIWGVLDLAGASAPSSDRAGHLRLQLGLGSVGVSGSF